MLHFKAKNKFFLALLFTLLIFFHYLGWLSAVENGARLLFIPVATKINHWRIISQNAYNYFFNQKIIMEQYDQCLNKNQILSVADAKLKNLEKENNELRKQLNFFHRQNFTAVTADVVGQNSNSVDVFHQFFKLWRK